MRRMPFAPVMLVGWLATPVIAQESLSTQVGAIREAYRTQRPLPGDSYRPDRKYRVLQLTDSLSQVTPDMVVRATSRPGDPATFSFRIEAPPMMDPTTRMPIPGTGASGAFSGTLRLLSPEEAKALEGVPLASPPATDVAASRTSPSSPSPSSTSTSSTSTSSTSTSSTSTTVQAMPSGHLAGYTLAPLPVLPANRGAVRDFYALSDPRTGLSIGMEKVTERTAGFWRRRLGLDAALFMGKYLYQESERIAQNERDRRIAYEPGWDPSSGLRAYREFTRLSPVTFAGYSPQVPAKYQDLLELFKVCAREDPDLGKLKDYLSAWKGFLWNLDDPEASTWVAYVTTRPVTSLLCDQPDGDVSTSVKMAMTVQITDGIYCPLGIYACPSGLFADQAKGIRRGPLALFLHAGVARLVDEANPGKVNLAVFRPIRSMRTLLEKSGIPYRTSPGFVGGGDAFQGEAIVDEASTASHPDLASVSLPYKALLLIDPAARHLSTIGRDHWFARSSYLGAMNYDRELMEQYPYFFIRRQDLARDLHAGSPQASHGQAEHKAEHKAEPKAGHPAPPPVPKAPGTVD